MKKKELVAEVAAYSGQTQEAVRAVLDAADLVVRTAVARGAEVFLFGIGKLVTSKRGPKTARHMVSGARVVVPARVAVLFRPSDALVAAANSDPLPALV